MRKFRMFENFNNIKIGTKLFLSYLLIVFLPLLLVGVLLISNMTKMAVENAIREASVNVDRAYTRINEVMKILMDVSYKLQMDKNLETLLFTDYKSNQEFFESHYQYMEFNSLINLYSSEIKEIKIYSENDTLFETGQFLKVTPEVQNSEWYKKVQEAGSRICWQYLFDKNKNGYFLCLTRLLKANLFPIRDMGTLVISINSDYLYSLMKSEPYDIFFCDDRGNIIAAKDRDMMGRNIQESPIADIQDKDDDIWQIDYLGNPSRAIVKTFEPGIYNGKFKIISIVPVSHIKKQAYDAAFLGIVIILSSLLLALLLIVVFTKAIGTRIRRLSQDMHIVAAGNFDIKPSVSGDDEIGRLARDLGTMVGGIKKLIDENNQINIQKNQLAIKQREIKLKLLANQINPHFLFNALETIRMNAHRKGDEEIAEVVMLLGKIMRKTMEASNELIPLESEMDLVKSYLKIQKFRYQDRINYDIYYENEEFRNCKVLSMTIQPIVENAIVHGLEYKQGEGNISIGIVQKDGFLVITVEDNGEGMSKERLREVYQSLNETEDVPGKRIGLKNVHQRIKLFYGDEYGLKIYSEKDRGTRVEMVIPADR